MFLCGGISLSLIVRDGTAIAPLTLIVFGGWCLFRDPPSLFAIPSPLRVLVICFAIYAIGSALISATHGDPPGHFEQYLPFLGASLMAVALQTNALRPTQFIGGFAAAAILAGSGSILQVLCATGIHRASFFTTPTTFGLLGVLYGVICASALGWPAFASSRSWRFFLFSGSMGGAAISLLSGSKGSWLALLVAGPIAFIQATRGFGLAARTLWALIVVLILTVISLLPHGPVVPRVRDFIQHRDNFRERYWTEGLDIVRSHPFAGAGRAEIRQRLTDLMAKQPGQPFPATHTADLHNEYLDILAAKGAMGLLFTLSAITVPLVVLIRLAFERANPAARTGVVFLFAFAIGGLTDVQFQISAKRMTYLLGVIALLHFASQNPEPRPTRR